MGLNRLVLTAAAVLAVLSCERAAFVAQPPAEYRADAAALVRFVADPHQVCGAIGAEALKGHTIRGCRRDLVVVLPNACTWDEPSDYAQLVCHELGHVNGWRHD